MRRAQKQMQAPKVRRFYTQVTVVAEDDAYKVLLDGRVLRTPAQAEISLPTELAATLIAQEFDRQGEHIEPMSMPVTRLTNTAIDGVASDLQAVVEDILRYASSDLLYYRADAPERLIALEAAAWDPVLEWAEGELGVRFVLAEGIMHVEQPRPTIAAVGTYLRQRREPLRLASLHVITTLTGSALLALAVDAQALDAEAAWQAAHVDEDWNIAQWGADAEAAERRENRKRDMMGAVALLAAIRE